MKPAPVLALLLFAAPAMAPGPAMMLTGDGFNLGDRTARFGRTNRDAALALATAALGRPLRTGNHGDCGQGDAIGYAQFRGGFELSFVRGRLSGWTADGPAPRTARRVGVGATLAALRRAYPDVETEAGQEADGGLGPRFQREGGPHGWLSGVGPGARVTGLFAGATCLAGI